MGRKFFSLVKEKHTSKRKTMHGKVSFYYLAEDIYATKVLVEKEYYKKEDYRREVSTLELVCLNK
jgi:hypothetical protein